MSGEESPPPPVWRVRDGLSVIVPIYAIIFGLVMAFCIDCFGLDVRLDAYWFKVLIAGCMATLMEPWFSALAVRNITWGPALLLLSLVAALPVLRVSDLVTPAMDITWQLPDPLLLELLFGASVVGGLILALQVRRAVADLRTWERTARRLGLRPSHEDAFTKRMHGDLGAFHVEIEEAMRGSGEYARPFMTVVVSLHAHGLPWFRVERRKVTDALSRAMGTLEVSTGDESFDRSFRTLGHAPRGLHHFPRRHKEAIVAFLNPARREVVEQALTLTSARYVAGVGRLSITYDGGVLRPDELISRVLQMAAFVEAIATGKHPWPGTSPPGSSQAEPGSA